MEFNEDFVKENNLTTDQIGAITNLYQSNVSELKKDWDNKANTNAEAIIQGAVTQAQKAVGIELPRNEGEKYSDYLNRISDAFVSTKKQSVDKLELEYQNKLKDFSGGDALKQEFEAFKEKADVFKQKAAQFDEWEAGDYKNKYENSSKELGALKQKQAFNSSKPDFPNHVNKFESLAKWKNFEGKVLAKYDVALNENDEAIAIDKDNNYNIKLLSDLVKEDEDIKGLLSKDEKQSNRGGGTNVPNKNIEGVPFLVSESMTPQDRNTAIKNYLTKELKLSITSREYSEKFSEYNKKLLKQV